MHTVDVMKSLAKTITIAPSPCKIPNLRVFETMTAIALAPLVQKLVPLSAVSVKACLLKNLINLSAHSKQQIKHLEAY